MLIKEDNFLTSKASKLVLSVSLLIFTSCSQLGFLKKSSADQNRLRQLERELKKTQYNLEEMRERNLVLEKVIEKQKLQDKRASKSGGNGTDSNSSVPDVVPVPFEPSAALERRLVEQEIKSPLLVTKNQNQTQPQLQPQTQAQPQPQLQTQAQPQPQTLVQRQRPLGVPLIKLNESPVQASGAPALASVDEEVQTGEQKFYSKVLESYRFHKSSELQKSLDLLLKAFPDSIYADNALYLAGMLAFEVGDLHHAEGYFNRVLREYPRGNKAAAALFARAMIEKRTGKSDQARTTLKGVRQGFPGSPEAARAETEAKFLDLAKRVKSREG